MTEYCHENSPEPILLSISDEWERCDVQRLDEIHGVLDLATRGYHMMTNSNFAIQKLFIVKSPKAQK